MKNFLLFSVWSMFVLTASPVFAQNFNLQLRSSLEYPGQTLANICGYAQDGKEYALLGASKGMVIVDVTNPTAPVNIVQIPGPDNLWKEIKVYQHYAYITSEGGQGLQIVDLSKLPSPNLDYYYYTGDGTIAGQLDRIHALHIAETKGFLYAHGGQLFSGGSKVFDLNADPYNPTYAGKFDALGYVHDGYADNDTLYACHINAGIMSIVDMSDKSNPKLLGTVETPGSFTHNSWLLDDRKTILTTDEDTPSFVTSYDISDPENIKELDRTSTNDGNNSIGHNTHVLGGWAVTSWYTDGVVISDVHRPDNMVITAVYDTWAGTGAGFDGCWGVYPYLPSGTVVVSNIPNTNGGTGKLFVFTPTYARACYLEGKILNGCDGQPLLGATIEVNSGNPWVNTVTKNDGTFKTGQAEEGSFKVTVSKPGYASQTLDVTLAAGQVTELNVTLQVQNAVDVKGVVLTEGSSTPIANAAVTLTGPDGSYTLQTNANGQFELDCVPSGDYEVNAGKWGFIGDGVVIDEQTIGAGTSTTIYLEPGYYDDFGVNLGWTNQSTASSGIWTLGTPIGTEFQGIAANPGFDSDLDNNENCYITGNGGGQAGTDDVDNGSATLSSPVMQLAGYDDAILNFWYWFFNDGGSGTPNDNLEVRVTNGVQTATISVTTSSDNDWRFAGDFHLKDFITLNDNVRVQFIASDDDPGHVVEAGVDIFKVVPVTASSVSPDIDASAFLKASPNPSATSFLLNYDWPTAQNATLEVRNALGQLMTIRELGANVGTVTIGDTWPKGVYIATLRSQEKQSAPIRLVKQ